MGRLFTRRSLFAGLLAPFVKTNFTVRKNCSPMHLSPKAINAWIEHLESKIDGDIVRVVAVYRDSVEETLSVYPFVR